MSEQGVVFLEGFKTILRPLDKRTDTDMLIRWVNNPALRPFTFSTHPMTFHQEEAWIDRVEAEKTCIQLVVTAKPEMKPIGMMGLHRIEWVNRTAVSGAMFGEAAYWGRGFGTDAKMVLLEHAFHELGLNKVTSNAFASNPRSIAYSMKCGYRVEGRRRQQIFKGGRFIDMVELGVLRQEWEPMWRRWKKTGSVK